MHRTQSKGQLAVRSSHASPPVLSSARYRPRERPPDRDWVGKPLAGSVCPAHGSHHGRAAKRPADTVDMLHHRRTKSRRIGPSSGQRSHDVHPDRHGPVALGVFAVHAPSPSPSGDCASSPCSAPNLRCPRRHRTAAVVVCAVVGSSTTTRIDTHHPPASTCEFPPDAGLRATALSSGTATGVQSRRSSSMVIRGGQNLDSDGGHGRKRGDCALLQPGALLERFPHRQLFPESSSIDGDRRLMLPKK
jgi:hypothetical protein